MTRFLLIDLNNLVRRAQHGKGTGDAGEDLAGIVLHTSLDMINFYYKHFQGGHIVICVDQSSWRYELYPEYKSNREYDSDDEVIKNLINNIAEYFKDKTNCTVLQSPKVEADDFIARWIQIHAGDCYENIIISGDYDFKQLVTDNTSLYAPTTKVLYTNVGVFSQESKPTAQDLIAIRYDQEWKVILDKNGEPLTFDPAYELFLKCIRGDKSDFILSAYPKVRETRIKKAWNDRGGLEWNNFINSSWGKNGENSVRERYEFNRKLIDLSMIPDSVIEQIDGVIVEEIQKPKRTMIPMNFSKYCGQHELRTMMVRANSYTQLLSSQYPLDQLDE